MTKYPAATPLPYPPLSEGARLKAQKAWEEFLIFASPKENKKVSE